MQDTYERKKREAERSVSTPWLVEVLLYVHRNRRFIRVGEPRTSTSTFTQLLSSGPPPISH